MHKNVSVKIPSTVGRMMDSVSVAQVIQGHIAQKVGFTGSNDVTQSFGSTCI